MDVLSRGGRGRKSAMRTMAFYPTSSPPARRPSQSSASARPARLDARDERHATNPSCRCAGQKSFMCSGRSRLPGWQERKQATSPRGLMACLVFDCGRATPAAATPSAAASRPTPSRQSRPTGQGCPARAPTLLPPPSLQWAARVAASLSLTLPSPLKSPSSHERDCRPIAAEWNWRNQRRMWRQRRG
jgi:hypothetical protein